MMSNSAKNQSTESIVSVQWASAFQKQAGEKALGEVLQAWQDFYAEKNQGNVIKIDIGESEPKK